MNTINIKALSEEVQKLEMKVKEAVELPSVEITDEGKVLTVNASGKWAALDPASQLPAVTSEDEGSLLTVNSSGEWAKGNPIVGNLDYSIIEQNTGLKFDNKEVYQLTVVFDPDPLATSPVNKTVNLSTYNIDKIIEFAGCIYRIGTSNDNRILGLNEYLSSSLNSYTHFMIDTGTLVSGLRFTDGEYGGSYITIRYTKNPEPGNREPDEESETKKVTRKKSTK